MTLTRYELLSPPLDPVVLSMTFPAYRHLLDLRPATLHLNEPTSPAVSPFAVGARVGSQPVGLALAAARHPGQEEAELLSVFVTAARRRQGIGSALLREVESAAAARGASRLQAVWMTGTAHADTVEGLLSRSGWPPPAPRMVSVRFTLDDLARVPWLGRQRLRPGFEVFPWVELTSDERRRLIASQRERSWIPDDLQPWDYDRTGFDEVTSLGMRWMGEVVAWIINHPTSATTLRITCSFIREDLGRRGRIVPLWAESFRRLAKTHFSRCSFATPLYHRSMVAFVTRWCGPWVSFLGETRGSAKSLGDATPSALPFTTVREDRACGPGREPAVTGDARARVSDHSAER